MSAPLLSSFKFCWSEEDSGNLFQMDVKMDQDEPTRRKRSGEEIMKATKRLKTQVKYDKNWSSFLDFHNDPKVENLDEEMFLQYFDYLITDKRLANSTLWSIFSMLNSESRIRCGPKLNDFFRLTTLIKSTERGYSPKQAMTFTQENIENFLNEAPSTGMYSLQKTALVIGCYGGLRVDEMVSLKLEDFQIDAEANYWIAYRVSKQKQENVRNRFHVPKNYAIHIQNYIEEIKQISGRFFRRFVPLKKDDKAIGKFTAESMGKNSIAKIPNAIATFLGLPSSVLYTGHSFRRTSATIFANSGATGMDLKKHMNWKSDAVVNRYVDQSDDQKRRMSTLMLNQRVSEASSDAKKESCYEKTMYISSCSNVVINF